MCLMSLGLMALLAAPGGQSHLMIVAGVDAVARIVRAGPCCTPMAAPGVALTLRLLPAPGGLLCSPGVAALTLVIIMVLPIAMHRGRIALLVVVNLGAWMGSWIPAGHWR